MKIKIDHDSVTRKLVEIRRRVGGKKHPFIPRPLSKLVEVDLDGEDIPSLVDDDGWLIRDNQPVFVYIRDHTTGPAPENPLVRKKVHFTFCYTLNHMEEKGWFESRYRVTNRVDKDNKYLIDIREGWSKSKAVWRLLYPCQHCLSQSGYRCFSYNTPAEERGDIVKSFDAKEALDFIWQHIDARRLGEKSRGLRNSTVPAGYHPDHSKISRAYREEKGYTCEECGVNLQANTSLTDVHHKDRDKRNNKYDNLECLCKLCHAKTHPHYKISDKIRWKIELARKQQSI